MARLLSKMALVALAVLIGCSGTHGDGGTPTDPNGHQPGDGGDGAGAGAVGGNGSGATSSSGGGSEGGGGSSGDPCPDDVICVDSLPFVDANTTSGAAALLDGYGCAPEVDEAGPERVYRLDLPKAGLLVASLDNLGAEVDVDVHILQERDASTCIERGHWDAAVLLTPGRFWIVVDTWVDGSGVAKEGSYELTLALTASDDFVADGLDSTVLDAGLLAFDRAWVDGETVDLEYGIIDYGMPSIEPRLFILDLRHGHMLYRELVSHGEGSQDPNDLTLTGSMSNASGSHASSVGLVVTAETYYGSNGYSLRLDGLEPGFNDNDRSRAIVLHGADYATQAFVNAHGYLGRSWGCPAIDPAVHEPIIDLMANGRLLLKYFDDPSWLSNSAYVAP